MRPAVYFVRDTTNGLIKIGYSGFATKRIAALRTGSPNIEVLRIVENGSRELERACHTVAASSRVAGEWFNIAESAISDIVEKAFEIANRPAVDNFRTMKDAPFLVRFEPSLKEEILIRSKREVISAAALIRGAVRVWLADTRKASRCK